MLLPIKCSQKHTHLFQTHRCTWHINKHKHSGSLCACCLSKPVVYVQTVQHSVWFLLLANVCLCSLCCSLCVLHFRLSLWRVSVSGEADRQVPPVLKNIYSLTHRHTQSHAPISRLSHLPSPEAPPSCASRETFTLYSSHRIGVIPRQFMEFWIVWFHFFFH